VIGDPQQLPPTVLSTENARLGWSRSTNGASVPRCSVSHLSFLMSTTGDPLMSSHFFFTEDWLLGHHHDWLGWRIGGPSAGTPTEPGSGERACIFFVDCIAVPCEAFLTYSRLHSLRAFARVLR